MVGWKGVEVALRPGSLRTGSIGRGSVLRVISLLSIGLATTGLAVTAGWGQSAAPAGEDLHGLKVVPVKLQPTPTPFPLDVSTGRVSELQFRAPETDDDGGGPVPGGSRRRRRLRGARVCRGFGYARMRVGAMSRRFARRFRITSSWSTAGRRVTADLGMRRCFRWWCRAAAGDHVRVIPVRRRGYSLWTPSSQNSLTMHDFNHAGEAERPAVRLVDYQRTAMRLWPAGHVRGSLCAESEEEHYPLPTSRRVTVYRKGGAEIRFVDAGPPTRRGEWVLEFAQSGELKKVRRVESSELREYPSWILGLRQLRRSRIR